MPGFPGCASSASASARRVHFWPFDGWDIPAGRSAIAEVYPALWSRGFANEGRTGDQHDAFSIAAWLSRADRDGSLAAFLKPDLSPPERTLAQVEGWILGVADSHTARFGVRGTERWQRSCHGQADHSRLWTNENLSRVPSCVSRRNLGRY